MTIKRLIVDKFKQVRIDKNRSEIYNGVMVAITSTRILIVPFGDIRKSILDTLGNTIGEIFNTQVEIYQEPLEIPKQGFSEKRGQYDVEYFLRELKPLQREKVLGVADVDLYTPGLNFIFGSASQIGGDVCVISITRLRQEFYGLNPNDSLFLDRVKKEAVHELGHLYGLMHCPDPECVMHFSNSLLDTDRKSYHFCKRCREILSLQRP